MKYLKTFEKISMEEQIELLNDLINENPLHKDNDFYMFSKNFGNRTND